MNEYYSTLTSPKFFFLLLLSLDNFSNSIPMLTTLTTYDLRYIMNSLHDAQTKLCVRKKVFFLFLVVMKCNQKKEKKNFDAEPEVICAPHS